MAFTLSSKSSTLVLLLIYRPGSAKVTDQFFNELSKHLEFVLLYKCRIVVTGDRWAYRWWRCVTSSSSLQQFWWHLTRSRTNTYAGALYHVYTRSDDSVVNLNVDPPAFLYDHSFISWQQSFTRSRAASPQKAMRCLKKWIDSSFVRLSSIQFCAPKFQTILVLYSYFTSMMRPSVN